MRNRWVVRSAIPFAVVLVSVLGTVAVGAQTTPSTPNQEDSETLTVTKTVVGTAPADATFVLHVRCEAPGNETVIDEDVTQGPTGGSKDFVIAPSRMLDCTVSETTDGGADSIRSCAGLAGTTSTCSDTGTISVGIVTVGTPTIVEITNTFNAATTTTAPAEVAPAVAAAGTFTG